jgi:uncharacterized protein YcbK (DUF882 family)
LISRRKFLKAMIGCTIAYSWKDVFASAKDRELNMHNIHTNERLKITYFASGSYDPDAIDKINYFLRCHYTNEVKPLDIKVIDMLCEIKDITGTDREISIISGYRSLTYNELLIRQGKKVSKNSLHQQGLAIDFAIDGVRNAGLARIARSLSLGGVGEYPEFIHIDAGRSRYWKNL